MLVNFTKMHGLGNDFVVIDMITQHVKLHSAHIKRIADRRFGIGCDQILLIEPPIRPDADFYYRIYNANGDEAEQCGNGARCAAKFVLDSGLVNSSEIVADYAAGQMRIMIADNQFLTVDMGKPSEVVLHEVSYDNENYKLYGVSMGNPHAVCLVPDLRKVAVDKVGEKLSKLSIFPEGANIGFMQLIDRSRVRLRVYERGVGETLSCGSGACAAVAVGQYLDILDNTTYVVFQHGELMIHRQTDTRQLSMSGPANSVYVGHFRL